MLEFLAPRRLCSNISKIRSGLKQRVDERRDRRAVRKHNQATKQGENHKDWNEPKLFPFFNVRPEI
jgi:hypothetical protein